MTTSQGTDLAFTDPVIEKAEYWIKHFDGTWIETEHIAKLAGVVRGPGSHKPEEIRKFPDVLKQACEMGHDLQQFLFLSSAYTQ